MKYEELEEKIIQWAKDRNILENSNAIKQISKTQEELDETLEALKKLDAHKGSDNLIVRSEIMNEVADGIGDMLSHDYPARKSRLGLDSTACLANGLQRNQRPQR